ncbi:phasin family protein [Chitinimonas taiwanensis]|jgi:poly(hydroxyalkanoate) granule-associated protein|uniref:Poly(Hydroxyalkanoate) granule-associated protein n=1 Tax=Chitinimonas taiwanensis DSM 18899 TaxID=1121279 RepID=A0A1K2HAY8_9NEIS|nr:phasin family protein [Chitinimonas taiwanensis]SFZ73887.1 poly(hydroxyalkanoate) granule-associated protein [Chitinimonas taiwanensis DSM 18899]
MAKSLKKATEEKQYAHVILESANQIWLAGLGAFAKAQGEGVKAFDHLVEAGKQVEEKSRKSAEEKVVAVTSKATETWDKLEQVFQDRVARALNTLGVPSNKDLADLNKRIDELNKSVNELLKKQTAKPAAAAKVEDKAEAKPAAAKAEAKPAAKA